MEEALEKAKKEAAEDKEKAAQNFKEEMEAKENEFKQALEDAAAEASKEKTKALDDLRSEEEEKLTQQLSKLREELTAEKESQIKDVTAEWQSKFDAMKSELEEFVACRISGVVLTWLLGGVQEAREKEIEEVRQATLKENEAALEKAKADADARVKAKEEEMIGYKDMYTQECKRRNIRVFCRVRPVLPVERKSGQDVNVTNFPLEDELEVLQDSSGTMSKRFEFDRVFRPASTQEEVFNEVAPTITSALDGYNCCIFAYGQVSAAPLSMMWQRLSAFRHLNMSIL
ncbi:KIN14Q [Symbiodinium sp. KB8]|nr:KIN14Q [Symbiodinium sp. KB8]